MRESSRRIGWGVHASIIGAVALIVFSIALALHTSHSRSASRKWVVHTHEVIETLASLGQLTSERELTVRNLLRTGDLYGRDQFHSVSDATAKQAARLMETVKDNPAQRERADRLVALVAQRGVELDAMLAAFDSSAGGEREQLLAGNVAGSVASLRQINDMQSAMATEERGLLAGRQATLDRSVWLNELLMPLTGGIGLLALLAGQWRVRRYIAQTRDAEADAAEAKKAADAANAFKSAFLANVSHEIRTPLAAILGYADMLRGDGLADAAERDHCLRTIRRSGEHLLTIVNDILDLSKIEAGRMSVERVPCAVTEIIADVASLFRRVAVERGLQFEVAYEGPIPERVRTDPTRLRQILMNLVGNGVKFTERGSVRVLVDLQRDIGPTPMPTPPLLRIRVIDTGVGMSPEATARLFRPFTQADASTTRRFGGTGLGLTISRHLAELMGGVISVDTEVGRGSMFTLTLDAGDLQGVRLLNNVVEAAEAPRASEDLSAPRLRGARVLLAEDGPDNQQITTCAAPPD